VLLGEPVVLYRRSDGTPVALEDRCCHRRAPLSRGRVEGDDLRCGYHGFLYEPSGAVVWVPGTDRIPSSARVRSYPVVEKHGYVWIWMGDAALADEGEVPDFHWNTAPGWTSGGALLPMKCNYMLVVDNLLDLSHPPFLHANSIGSADDTNPELTWERGERFVRGVRIARDIAPTPRLRKMGVKSNIDTDKVMTYLPAGNVVLEITQTIRAPGDGPGAYHSFILNAMTPETESSCHYFWRNCRDYEIGNAELTKFLCGATATAFEEDKAMLEHQQAAIDLDPEAPEVNIKGDLGSIQARRLLQSLLSAEAPPARAAA
jgi:phenylpropionate dioxygenase-like ring-hydroxylating dioxygenase large terminal subunit